MREMQEDILAKAVAKKKAEGALHLMQGKEFLEANAKQTGVKVKEVTLADGSRAQLQYKVLKSGSGDSSPKVADTVVVNFTGTLIDGTLFDSSARRGEAASTFSMSKVIPGWSEALQVMKVGDKWQLFVPPTLAYADYGPPEIGMHTTLIYELELIGFSAPSIQ